MSKRLSRNQKSKKRSLYLGVDVPLLLTVVALLAFGLLMVYSAGWEFSVSQLGEEPGYMFFRQLKFVAVGIVLALIAFFFGYQRLKKWVVPLLILAIILLLLVIFFFGETRLGAKRTLFQGSIQPSEFAKLAMVVYLAYWLDAKKETLNDVTFGLIPLILSLGTASGLIMAQPDISAAATVIMMGGIMFYLGEVEIRQIITVLIITLVVGIILVYFVPTGRERLNAFISGIRDPQFAHYQVQRSIEAIVHGGLLGVGIGRATTKFTGLPVAPTDSIYAVIAEETGIVGAALVVILFLVFLWRGLHIANHANDHLGKLVAAGVTIWVFLEAAINMSVMVNLMPIAGNALPFISAGGSSMVTVLSGVGLVMSVARASAIEKNKEEGRSLHEVVNLRGDDGRRHLSGSRRSASARR